MNLPLEKLRCPDCKNARLIIKRPSEIYCEHCMAAFPFQGHRPILLSHDNTLFPIDAYLKEPQRKAPSFFARAWPKASVNLSRKIILLKLQEKLHEKAAQNTVLVIGGGAQKSQLNALFHRTNKSITVIYSDIDLGADVDLFCDGHNLPFQGGTFDAVVTTAVLEHVMYPEKVASEITRVLKCDGLLYSELPFMQQVHEGAYDFTRYTLSGHRRLFNMFGELESGLVAGPATAMVWSIENFALAFFRSKALRMVIKALVRLLVGWIKYLDYVIKDRPEALDGAACTFFFGSKSSSQVLDVKIIEDYVGAKVIKHV